MPKQTGTFTREDLQMKHHDLKIFTKYFDAVADGVKRSEVRYDDRGFEVGDTITFKEGAPSLKGFQYTGREISAKISYIDDFGCQHGYVNLSLSFVGLLRID